LQPLVENAIYHGIKPKLAPGTIRIFARAAADALELVVEDDGVGMGSAALAQLIAEIDSPEATQSVGLHNIQQRLKLIYGSGYGLHITSQPGAGTTVTVRLPLQKGDTNGDDCNL
jgi:two-component system sensor histidine kinase YesM